MVAVPLPLAPEVRVIQEVSLCATQEASRARIQDKGIAVCGLADCTS